MLLVPCEHKVTLLLLLCPSLLVIEISDLMARLKKVQEQITKAEREKTSGWSMSYFPAIALFFLP